MCKYCNSVYCLASPIFPSSLAYWLGLTLKCFLNTSRKYLASLNPVISATSVMVYFCSFSSYMARFRRISRT